MWGESGGRKEGTNGSKSLLLNIRYSFNSSMEGRKGKKSVEEIVDGAVDNIFKKYDENNNDFIDYPEFCKLIGDLNLGNRICQKEIDRLFELLDVNGDGKVSKDELADAFIAVKSSNR